MNVLRVGGLFSGIGGIELGLEQAGMRVLWHCEQDAYARAVLDERFPGIPCYDDVCELRGADVEPVDVLCGGFPCQDISLAGRGAGIDGARSGLWSEYARLIGELRPRYVVVENVSALLARGLGRVLGDLAALGFDAEWDCLPASAFGAPHRRDRLWIVAYPSGAGRREDARGAHGDEAAHEGWSAQHDHLAQRDGESDRARALADTDRAGREQRRGTVAVRAQQPAAERSGEDVADPAIIGHERPWPSRERGVGLEDGGSGVGDRADEGRAVDDAGSGRHRAPEEKVRARRDSPFRAGWWATEPDVGRVAHGIPARVDRLRCLGNAVVPQIPYWIGRRIIEYEGGVT